MNFYFTNDKKSSKERNTQKCIQCSVHFNASPVLKEVVLCPLPIEKAKEENSVGVVGLPDKRDEWMRCFLSHLKRLIQFAR